MGLIQIDDVSKVYKRHARRELMAKRVADKLGPKAAGPDEFWALRNISFRIARSESVAIVGNNGAGKSTLLSIIAGVTAPTSGRVQITGRISALLELGAGFHPDLTGRENAMTYAALVGLNRREARERMDAIIEFSELEEFIDQPLRVYSTGMTSRLGFSVAVHVDPEVLILDEVLAVGDGAFQAKGLKRIEQMARSGITLLFVSHSLGSVRSFCDRAIWLDHGKLVEDGPSDRVVEHYEQTMKGVQPAPALR
jgi:lipopolysaccharide transport system ATP-binding protein